MRIESSQVSNLTNSPAWASGASRYGPVAVSTSRSHLHSMGTDTTELSQLAGTVAESDRADIQALEPEEQLAALSVEGLLGLKVKWTYQSHSTSISVRSSSATESGDTQVVSSYYSESERLKLRIKGVLETADGQIIRFNVKLVIRRETQSFTTNVNSTSEPEPLPPETVEPPVALEEATFEVDEGTNPEESAAVVPADEPPVVETEGEVGDSTIEELPEPQTASDVSEPATSDSESTAWTRESEMLSLKFRMHSRAGHPATPGRWRGSIHLSSPTAAIPVSLESGVNSLRESLRRAGIDLEESGARGTIEEVELIEG